MKHIGKLLDVPTLLLCIYKPETYKIQNWYFFYGDFWLWFIGFALVYYVVVNEWENQISGMEMRPSNIYYYVTTKHYIVSTQICCVRKRSLAYTQKNLLCIRKRSLVHAQHSCACSGPGNPGANDPKRQRSRAWDLTHLYIYITCLYA